LSFLCTNCRMCYLCFYWSQERMLSFQPEDWGPGQKKDFFSKESEGGKWRTDVWESVQISWSTPSDWNKGSVIGSWAQCRSSQPRGLCQNTTLNIKFHISQSGLIDYCLVVSKIANHKNAQKKWISFDSQWGFKIKVSTTTYLYNLHFLVLLRVRESEVRRCQSLALSRFLRSNSSGPDSSVGAVPGDEPAVSWSVTSEICTK